MDLTERLRRIAFASGCAGFGICSAERFGDVTDTLRARADRGLSARLGFTYTDPTVAGDVSTSYPWARLLCVVAYPYLPAAGAPGPPLAGTGRVARFAVENHYLSLRGALDGLSAELAATGARTATLSDDSRLVDRAAAVRAGVGWWGKNTMVLVPGHGPWVLLGSVVTDAELEASGPMARDCGTCSACLPACPTGALIEPGVLDARLCLSYWLQAPGVIPRELRRAVGDRIYGCDDCIEACPPGGKVLSRAEKPRGRVDLFELLASDDDTLLDRFGHFYIPRRHPRYLRRNALIALGNSGGGRRAASVAADYLGHSDWLLRAHAAWALGALAEPLAETALTAAFATEQHEMVRAEIVAAGDTLMAQ